MRLFLVLLIGLLGFASPGFWSAEFSSAAFSSAAFSSAHAREHSAKEIPLEQLPREAKQTLTLIKQGGPFAHAQDGTVFGNRERLLPGRNRGYYLEYTVPTPGARNRGARRIVAGHGVQKDVRSSGEYWYTDDHYQSFRRIRE